MFFGALAVKLRVVMAEARRVVILVEANMARKKERTELSTCGLGIKSKNDSTGSTEMESTAATSGAVTMTF
ncbi:hypothetical protein DVH05_005012 [Phytophthora capsici]|nr:hypothetical protein DVH05_005012 [Phytophthora capsici]